MSDIEKCRTEWNKVVLDLRAKIATLTRERDDLNQLVADLTEAARERDALRTRLEEAEKQRNLLLCRIHRDGGHYIVQHGLDKAVEDADDRVAGYHPIIDIELPRLREQVKVLKEAMQEIVRFSGTHALATRVARDALNATDAAGLEVKP